MKGAVCAWEEHAMRKSQQPDTGREARQERWEKVHERAAQREREANALCFGSDPPHVDSDPSDDEAPDDSPAREVPEAHGRILTEAEILAQEEDGGPETEFERQQFIFFMTMRDPPY